MFKNRLPELNQERRKVCESRMGGGDNSKPRPFEEEGFVSTLQMFTGNYGGPAGKICNIYGKGL